MTDRTRALFTSALLVAVPAAASAYTAAGDRIFPLTLLLPEIAPSDDLYLTPATQPLSGAGRSTGVGINIDKTITERLGIGLGDGYSWFDAGGRSHRSGWQNLTADIQYLAVLDPAREFLLSLGIKREFGGTGAPGIGASPLGAATPTVYFGKGLGDVAPPYLRPLAVEGLVGFAKSDGAPRPDLATGGFAVEYSIPYLESKVSPVALPDLVRSLTPVVEFAYATPAGSTFGAHTTGIIAPGVTYAGEGFEFGLEGQIPATRATGRGVGVIARLSIALDYFFPETIGRPMFAGP